jgi:ADP-ribose pyrophosphatase
VRRVSAAQLVDELGDRPVLARESVFAGRIWDVRREQVDLGAGGVVTRDFVDHPGAVAVVALDDQERVLLIRQYRHPVRMYLWEPPAGLLDIAGEPSLAAAQREFHEEADLTAGTWNVLIDWFNSPGGSNEMLRCYLARDVRGVPEGERHERTEEELDMPAVWVPLDQAVEAVLAGRVHNPAAVVGLLAVAAARAQGWRTLLPGDAPWPLHPGLRA